jgi:succinate dehydrogenase hydrophobic anchor subunit
MLPLKWKIFKVINYLILLAAVGIIGFSLFNIIRHFESNSVSDLLVFGLELLIPLILAINSTINLYVIDRGFPDNYAKTVRKASNVFLVLTIIILVFLFPVFVYIIIDALRMANSEVAYDKDEIWFLIAFFFLICLVIYICHMQIVLGNTIRDNFEKSF